ncbi:MAG: hypothetical protein ABW133_06135, partial [Polyangiaceae bacterium]
GEQERCRASSPLCALIVCAAFSPGFSQANGGFLRASMATDVIGSTTSPERQSEKMANFR